MSHAPAAAALAILAGAGCSFDGRTSATDAPPGTIDARRIDAPPVEIDAEPDPGHLLLSEIRTFGTSEFVEIYNPTLAPIQLENYYLTDIQSYWDLPSRGGGNPPVTPANDFMVRFPDGAELDAGEVATIAMSGPAFLTAFGPPPTYTIQTPTAGATPMALAAYGVSIGASITNDGEMVALFFWDGESDLVADADLVIAGSAPVDINTFIPREPVDGPDVDTVATPYAPDALTIQDFGADTTENGGLLRSYKRIALETGQELVTGGNGEHGHDETSEQTRATWDSRDNGDDYTAPTPGTVDIP
jgi:hypothetical protein